MMGGITPDIDVDDKIDRSHLDPFGRLKVVEKYSLWQFSHRYGDDVSRYFSTASVGTYAVNTDRAAMVITNTTTNTDRAIYRTKRYFEYHKGRAQSFMTTVNPRGQTTSVTKRWGMMDDDNGIFFQLDGTNGFELVVRSSTTGSVVETKVAQSSFNIDKANGSGPSAITLDFTKFNLFYIEFSWLGTNQVEFGFVSEGTQWPLHRFNFSNTLEYSYTQSANLPVGYEIENNAGLGAAPTMEVNCIDVSFEGLNDVYGQVIDIDTGASEITVGPTAEVVGAVRMQSTKNKGSLKPVEFDLISTSGNSTIYYQVQIGTVLGGTPTWNPLTGSIAETLSGTTQNFTNGIVIQSGYLRASSDSTVVIILSDIYAGRLVDGTSEVLAVVCQTIVSNSKLLFSERFKEFK